MRFKAHAVVFFVLIATLLWMTPVSAATLSYDLPDNALLTPDNEMIFSERQSRTSAAQRVVVRNPTGSPLAISAELTGTHKQHFRLNGAQAIVSTTILANSTITLEVAFSPKASVTGPMTAQLKLVNGGDNTFVNLYGLSFQWWEGSKEPPFKWVVQTLGYAINVGWNGLTVGTPTTYLGDEVHAPLFRRAGNGPVQLVPVARFSPAEPLEYGYYTYSGQTPITTETAVLSGELGDHQRLHPPIVSGGYTFNVGSTPFGIYTRSEFFNRTNYTEDHLNTDGVLRRARVYPLKDRAGALVENAYFIGFEDATNGDYQDYVYVLLNVVPVSPPTVSSPISDVSAVYGQAASSFSVFPNFADLGTADEDLTYTVTGNTHPAVVSTSAIASTDGSLTLTFAEPGSSQITVRATDPEGDFIADTFTVTVTKASTDFTVTPRSASSVFGQPVTFDYSLAVLAPGGGTPTGNVTITNGTDSCTAAVSAGSCTITFSNAGSKTLTATYAGDTHFNGDSAPNISHTVNQASTTLQLTGALTSNYGAAATFNVSLLSGAGTPPGSVIVNAGVGESCTATLTNGSGSCTITFSSTGSKTVTAAYAGSGNYAASESSPLVHTVNKANTTAMFDAPPLDSTYQESVPFTVWVASPDVTPDGGLVTITDGAHTCEAALENGEATCFLTFENVGLHTLTATYAGTSSFNGSTTSAFGHTVAAAQTTTRFSAPPASATYGDSVTFTVNVSSSTVTPVGMVTLSDGEVLCEAVLTEGSGGCALAFQSSGEKTITATYGGNANIQGSSAQVVHTVNKALVSVDFVNPVTSAYTNTAIPLALTVESAAGVALAGTVTVAIDGLTMCTITLPETACDVTFETTGTKTLTAAYVENANFAPQSGDSVTIEVSNPAPLARADGFATGFGLPLSVPVPGVLGNDNDVNHTSLTAVLVEGSAQGGTLALNSDGSFTYTPPLNFSGEDSFTYQASDGSALSEVVTVTLIVTDSPLTPTPTDTPTPTATQTPTITPTATATATTDPAQPTATATATNPAVPTATATATTTDSLPTATPDSTDEPLPSDNLQLSGDLTSGVILPTFIWRLETLADWYNLRIVDATGAPIFDKWFPAADVCGADLVCQYTLTTADMPAGLLNGAYTWTISAWRAAAPEMVTPLGETTFTVAVPAPVPPINTTVDVSSGRPVIVLPDDPGTTWLHVYIGTPDFSQTMNFSWYALTACDGTTCTLLPNAHPLNGDYVLYLQSWGPAGYEADAWVGPFTFTLDAAPAAPIAPITPTQTTPPAFSWQASAGATWYWLWVGPADYSGTLYLEWLPATALGCHLMDTCAVTLETLPLSPGVPYEWWVMSWGPGGVDMNAGVNGWVKGDGFTP